MKKITLILLMMCFSMSGVHSLRAQSWSLTGNGGTIPSSNFLGTTDNKKLNIATNNKTRMTIAASGNVGIGINAPTSLLHVAGQTLITDNPSMFNSPVLVLSTFNNNCVMHFKLLDTLKAVLGFDQSTNDFVISTQQAGYTPDFIQNRATGFTGLNTKTPQERLHVVGNAIIDGDITLGNTTGKGDINFTTEHQNIAFANPSSEFSSAMMYMTVSPTAYKRMVLAHSGAFSNWGLQYDDADDQFDFLGAGSSKLSVDLTDGNVGIGTATPANKLDVQGGANFSGNIGVQTAANTRTIQCGSTQGALLGIGTLEYIQDAGTNTLSTASDWVPVTDNTWSLGNASNRWQDVWAVDGTINTSDATMKTNIRDMSYGLDAIMQLRPVSYQWKNDQSYTKLGVIAQEIQKVLPEVVRDWDYEIDETTGAKTKVASEKLGVMYDDIIPVLIKGMQEQQEMIAGLQSTVSSLQSEVASLKGEGSSELKTSSVEFSGARLEQNFPNPFDHSTTISYFLPENTMNASIQIVSLKGEIIKSIPVTGSGNGQLVLKSGDLQTGNYYYSLFIDGRSIDTKQLNISK